MLFTWFPELLPVYRPLLPSPLANIHTVLLCYRWVQPPTESLAPSSAPDSFNSTGQKFWEVLQQKPHSSSTATLQKHHLLLSPSPFTNTTIIVVIKCANPDSEHFQPTKYNQVTSQRCWAPDTEFLEVLVSWSLPPCPPTVVLTPSCHLPPPPCPSTIVSMKQWLIWAPFDSSVSSTSQQVLALASLFPSI